jgi:hypothetical protein
MYFGHIGVAFASKLVAPKVSIGVLLFSVTLLDTLSGIFIAFGVESISLDGTCSIPWSHGLFMSIILSIGIAFIISRNIKTSIIIGLLVFSHWILDFISHPMGMGKDLPKDIPLLFENSTKVGLGLYKSIIAALVSDIGLLIVGLVIYLKKTKSVDQTGKWAIILLILFIVLFPLTMLIPFHLSYLITFISTLMLPIGIWVDRHRKYIYKKEK